MKSSTNNLGNDSYNKMINSYPNFSLSLERLKKTDYSSNNFDSDKYKNTLSNLNKYTKKVSYVSYSSNSTYNSYNFSSLDKLEWTVIEVRKELNEKNAYELLIESIEEKVIDFMYLDLKYKDLGQDTYFIYDFFVDAVCDIIYECILSYKIKSQILELIDFSKENNEKIFEVVFEEFPFDYYFSEIDEKIIYNKKG